MSSIENENENQILTLYNHGKLIAGELVEPTILNMKSFNIMVFMYKPDSLSITKPVYLFHTLDADKFCSELDALKTYADKIIEKLKEKNIIC